MKIHDVQQGSPQWEALRLGIPTASDFDKLLTPSFAIRTGEMPKTYLHKKLAEKFYGRPMDEGSTFNMDQGNLLEREAMPWLAFAHDIDPYRVGFCTTDDGRIGCSPDALIGEESGLEIKCPTAPIHLKYLLNGELPEDYRCQVHGSMYVTGRPRWMFLSYTRNGLPKLLLTVQRDEAIQAKIHEALTLFLANFDAKYAVLSAMAAKENAGRPL